MSYSVIIYQNGNRVTEYSFKRTLRDINVLKERLKTMIEMFPESEGYLIKLMQENMQIDIEKIMKYSDN